MKLNLKNISSFAIIAAGVALAFLINSLQGAISPLFLSMLFGLLITNTIGWNEKEAMNFAAKRCLRLGVVLLGFQISFDQFVDVGLKGLLAVAVVVVVVFSGTRLITRRLGLSHSLSTFIAGGFAICGATAIAAISATLLKGKSAEEQKEVNRDLSYAVAIVALCGTLSVFVLPLVARLLGLTDSATGAWIGAAVHDVGQVVATASLVSDEAIESSIIVKLSRVVPRSLESAQSQRFCREDFIPVDRSGLRTRLHRRFDLGEYPLSRSCHHRCREGRFKDLPIDRTFRNGSWREVEVDLTTRITSVGSRRISLAPFC
jgi:uncharacterized integral membrane protein (TIGR00698 family)